jgi:multidrug efflux pump subunit AcrB
MFFMPGIFGKFVFVIPLAISLALFISLAEASVVLPAHLAHCMQKSRGAGLRTWFHPIKNLFGKYMMRLLKLRYIMVLLSIVILIASLWYAKNYIKFILFPSDSAQELFILVEMPTGSPLDATSSKIMEIENIVARLPDDELASFNTRIGMDVRLNAESESYGAMAVFLTPYTERSRTADQIVEDLRLKTDSLSGFKSIVYSINTGGPPVGKPVNIRVTGSDDRLRTKLTDSIEALLGTIEGVKDITRDDRGGKEQVVIDIDYDKLSRLGLTVADVAQNVRVAYDGQVVTSVRYGEEDVDFRIMMSAEARQNQQYLRNLQIPNNRGRLIPLRDVAQLRSGPGHSDYRHYNGERTITVEADLIQDVVIPAEVTEAVLSNFDLDNDWPGMHLGMGGEVIETAESMAGLYRTMIIAVVAIYFLLVILFNSFSQPILVMLAIPFGTIGVIIAFAVHAEPFSFVAIMGVVGLSGVVVNDSLILVNHLNNLKKKGGYKNMKQLVSEGTADRLRPIVMTTLSTVAALLPLAYGLGGTALFMAPMALALGWGLVFATPLTLVLLPCLYVIKDDVSRIFRRSGQTSR